jgi:hypothetical protein
MHWQHQLCSSVVAWMEHIAFYEHMHTGNYYLLSSTNHEVLITQFSQPLLTSSLLGPNVFLSILFLNTLVMCSFSATDQDSRPYNHQAKL